MRTVNQLVEKLYKEAKHKMLDKQKNDRGAYQELIKNLLIQVTLLFTNLIGLDQVYGARGERKMQKE